MNGLLHLKKNGNLNVKWNRGGTSETRPRRFEFSNLRTRFGVYSNSANIGCNNHSRT